MADKQRDLSSDIMGLGEGIQHHFNKKD